VEGSEARVSEDRMITSVTRDASRNGKWNEQRRKNAEEVDRREIGANGEEEIETGRGRSHQERISPEIVRGPGSVVVSEIRTISVSVMIEIAGIVPSVTVTTRRETIAIATAQEGKGNGTEEEIAIEIDAIEETGTRDRIETVKKGEMSQRRAEKGKISQVVSQEIMRTTTRTRMEQV